MLGINRGRFANRPNTVENDPASQQFFINH
jgi:hypothetical protein